MSGAGSVHVDLDSPEVRWVFSRAFGPVRRVVEPPHDPDAALALARVCDLEPRIGARQPADLLIAELGPGVAEQFLEAYRETAARTMLLTAATRALSLVAQQVGAPIILLKGIALHACGAALLGSRPTSDIDVLVPRGAGEALTRELQEHGYVGQFRVGSEHHHPAELIHAGGFEVEIHVKICGLCLGSSRRWAQAPDLTSAGLCEPADGWPRGVLLPSRDVLIAHAIVHGIAFHGAEPQLYSPFRMLSDLVDLGFGNDVFERFLNRSYAWIQRAVKRQQIEQIAGACALLSAGSFGIASTEREHHEAATFLRRTLGGLTHPVFGEALKLRQTFLPLTEERRVTQLLRSVVPLLRTPEARANLRPGQRLSTLDHVIRSPLRFLVLLGKLARYIVSWLRVRFQREVE